MFLDLVATLNTEHLLCALQVFSLLIIPTPLSFSDYYLSSPFFHQRDLAREAKVSNKLKAYQTPELCGKFCSLSLSSEWPALLNLIRSCRKDAVVLILRLLHCFSEIAFYGLFR